MNCKNCGEATKVYTASIGQDIYCCTACGLRMIDEGSICSNPDYYEKLLNSVKTVREINFRKILSNICALYDNRQNLYGLEVGCAEGQFIEKATQYHIRMIGIEPMERSCETAKQKGCSVIHGFFPEDMPDLNEKFDFIVFNDVFEHIPNSRNVLTACRELLCERGIVVINLPVTSGITYRTAMLLDRAGSGFLLRRLYQLDTESPHVLYYNKQSLGWITSNSGFRSVQKSQRMKSYTFKSIRERIEAVPMDIGRVRKQLLWAGGCLAYPFVCILPADTRAFYFQKAD